MLQVVGEVEVDQAKRGRKVVASQYF